jgi:hypothetical protein
LVTVQNVDTESDLGLDGVTVRVRPVADNNSNYQAVFCLRSQGSSVSTCPEAVTSTSTGSVPGSATPLLFATAPVIAKNGSTYSFEIFVDSNFVDPINLQGQITRVWYDGVYEDVSLTVQ